MNVVADAKGGTAIELAAGELATKRSAGRPYGTKADVSATHQALRHTHFSYVRFAIEGFALRDAWLHCLAFAGGVDDERYFARLLREVSSQIRAGARARGLEHLAERALRGMARVRSRGVVKGSAPALAVDKDPVLVQQQEESSDGIPALDDWVSQRCAELGIDVDFQTQAEWLAEYQEAFDLPELVASPCSEPSAVPSWTGDGAKGSPVEDEDAMLEPTADSAALRDQLDALNALTTLLAVPLALEDDISVWLSSSLCARLNLVGVKTVANLADYVELHGHRWHARVQGLGAVRAKRITEWLGQATAQLGRPLREMALKPAAQVALARDAALSRLDPLSVQRFGVVPLERLAVPPELSGRHGTFRVLGANTFGVEDDLDALKSWLQRYSESPRTYLSYTRAVEAFYLWCLTVRRKALSSAVEADLHAFRSFVQNPPADWVQPRPVARTSQEWRPFRGALDPKSQRHLFSVLGSMFSGLVDAGYISAHAARGVMPHLKLPRASINVRRTFTEAQWSCVMHTMAQAPDTSFTRRARLVLELGATAGLRLIEICTARLEDLRQELDARGEPVWLLRVMGKGGRERDVRIYDDIKALIDRHHQDMSAAGIGFDSRAPLRKLLSAREPSDGQASQFGAVAPVESENAVPTHGKRPLVGALRAPVPRWKLDPNGVAVLDRLPVQADAYGAIDPSALYQMLKRVFARAAEAAQRAGVEVEGGDFRQASTHWLRHFFANTALADGVELVVLRDAMGHASLQTTSVYVKPEQKALLREMAKMRRRG